MTTSLFHPTRVPFFYGWVILVAGSLGILFSLPGQTIGVSAFTDSLIGALSLTRTQVSLAYMIGTLASALLLPAAGAAYDRFGATRVAAAACGLLGGVLGLLGRVDRIAAEIAAALPALPLKGVSLTVLALCFFLLRFSGQGVLTLVSRNMMMKWFDRRRGLVTGFTGFVISPAFSVAPTVFNHWVETAGWRATWLGLGLAIGIGFTVVVLLFFRDNPEDYGLLPDGAAAPPPSEDGLAPHPPVAHAYTLGEVIRTPTYWIFSVGISLFAFHMTGLSFHMASVFETAGFDAAKGFAAFIPSAVISVVLRPAVGWCADRVPLRFVLVYLLAALGLSAFGMAWLPRGEAGVWILILGNGLAGSSFDTLMSVVWPNFYGREHVGAISSLAMSVTVFASALAPLAYSACLDATGGYAWAGAGSLAVAVCLALLALGTRNPQRG